MKNSLSFRKNALFTVSLFLATYYANAQVMIAYCKLDGGCKFYQTSYAYAQVDGMLGYLGTFEKDKGILVFFKNKQNQDTHYPDRKRSPRQLHEYFGGKGEPTIAKGGIAPFEEAIQPKDGNWEAKTDNPVAKNCPSQLSMQLKGIASVKSGQRIFKKPFTPEELLPPKTPWLTIAPNMYKAFVLPQTEPAFKTIYDFEVVSPTLVKGATTTLIQIPTQATCEVKTNFTFKHKN